MLHHKRTGEKKTDMKRVESRNETFISFQPERYLWEKHEYFGMAQKVWSRVISRVAVHVISTEISEITSLIKFVLLAGQCRSLEQMGLFRIILYKQRFGFLRITTLQGQKFVDTTPTINTRFMCSLSIPFQICSSVAVRISFTLPEGLCTRLWICVHSDTRALVRSGSDVWGAFGVPVLPEGDQWASRGSSSSGEGKS